MEGQKVTGGFIAVHLGAGYHGSHNFPKYKEVCERASKKAMQMIQCECSSLDVITEAVAILEDCPLTNAGTGSNLTLSGAVECDASIMDGRSLHYGSVGALSSIKNPIRVCRQLITEQMKGPLSCGRIPPCFLVGNGALQWSLEHGISRVPTSDLLTRRALTSYRKFKRRLSTADDENQAKLRSGGQKPVHICENPNTSKDSLLDTVGAICMDSEGSVSSAVSSGGIALKHPGRIGQAASYGCGCWAANGSADVPAVACSTSGCGEHLIRTLLAKECCDEVVRSDGCLAMGLDRVFKQKFLESSVLAHVDEKLGGALVLRHSQDDGVELVWAHTTPTMCLGYMNYNNNKPKFQISTLPATATAGKSLHIQGINCKQPP